MAFPRIDDMATTVTSNTTNPILNLPPNITAGDGLLIVLAGTSAADFYDLDGFTELWKDPGNSNGDLYVAYKVADGTEGPTMRWQLSIIRVLRVTALRFDKDTIADWSTTPPETNIVPGESGIHLDPPLLSPSWGAQDTTWLAALSWQQGGGTAVDPIAIPIEYVEVEQILETHTLNWVTQRQANVSIENPGPFDVTGFSVPDTSAGTIGILGKEGAPAGYTGFGAVNI